MTFDADRYETTAMPAMQADPTLRDDAIVRYGIENEHGAVPDPAHLKMVVAYWLKRMDEPSFPFQQLASELYSENRSVPVNDPGFWADQWMLHDRRAAAGQPVRPNHSPTSSVPGSAQPEAPSRPIPDPVTTPTPPVDEGLARLGEARTAIDEGRLSHARAILSTFPVVSPIAQQRADHLQDLISERAKEADDLIRQANDLVLPVAGSVSDAMVESAGELLDRACRLDVGDQRAAQALQRIPAPAPTDVDAQVVGGEVLISWQPSAVRFGSVRYTVMRVPAGRTTFTAATADEVGSTTDLSLADRPEDGREFRFGVVASREGCRQSRLVEAPNPVVVTGEVADLRVQFRDGRVFGSWRRPERCNRVLVVRTTDDTGESTELDGEVRLDDFVDADVAPGTDYRYTVICRYLVDGREVRSAGRSQVVSPLDAPEPVETISGTVEDDRYLLVWTTPPAGDVLFRRLDERPTLRVGDHIDLEAAGHIGEPIRAEVQRGPTESRASIELPSGLSWFLPITVNGATAVVGQVVQVDHLKPIEGLDARRHGAFVNLSWLWPVGATDARAVVSYRGETIYNRTLSRAELDREGGLDVPVGPEAVVVQVTALGSAARGRRQSAPVSVTVPARPPTVYFEARRNRSRGVVVVSDRDCRVTRLVFVAKPGQAPLSEQDGRPIWAVEDIELLANVPKEFTLNERLNRREVVGCFAGTYDQIQIRRGLPTDR